MLCHYMFVILFWGVRGSTVNALHHGRTNRYTFLHKGEFSTILPKDAKNIKCTVEVFKKKSAKYRTKPRRDSFQGREDDVIPCVVSTDLVNKVKLGRH